VVVARWQHQAESIEIMAKRRASKREETGGVTKGMVAAYQKTAYQQQSEGKASISEKISISGMYGATAEEKRNMAA